MNPKPYLLRLPCRSLAGVTLFATGAYAQPTAPAANAAPEPEQPSVVSLSPFEVNVEEDRGYFAAHSLAGTRLNTRVEDLASSISIVTKQQLLDTAAVDLNDIFLYESNTEGTHQFTDFEIVTGGAGGDIVVDRTGTNPASANRVRGMGGANISMGGFEMTGGIPIDTYNIDAVEISRGPNSNIFGLGNPAGSVNLIAGQAGLSRRSARAKFQVDSYGGTRVEGAYQIPVKENVLGIALYGVLEDKGFTRKPSHDRTERFTIGATFRPFQRTTIRGSFERYDNHASLPNSITPRDLVSQWVEAGRPTWDPVTGTLTRGDGTTMAGVNWGNRVNLFQPGGGVNLYSDSFVTRMNQYVDNGQVTYFTTGFRPANLAANATTIPGPITPGIANNQFNYQLSSGHVFDYEQQVLWRPAGISDSSLYNWEDVNFAAPNHTERQARTTNVSIDQLVFQTPSQYLAVQGAYFSQDVDGWSRDFIGSSGGIAATLMVDINERLLDGSPNPYFMRPFMAGSEPQIRNQIDESETFRLQTAYRLDVSERGRWGRWLGVHSLVGYGEKRERTSGTPAYRSYLLPAHPWYTEYNADGTARAKVGNSYRMTYRYYLGDDNGYNVDYAAVRPANINGQHSLRWYDARSQQWVNEDVTIEELFDANRLKREQRYTMGLIWQGNMFDDRIVPTFGYRNDRLTEFEGPSRTWYDNGYPNIEVLRDFDDPNYAYNKNYGEGNTTTKGIVVKPLRWLHFFYNQSDSFRPAGLAYDIKGDILDNPSGEGKDYGVSIRLGQKLSIKYNQYEMREENARTGGSSGTMTSRLQRIDFDISRSETRLPDATDRWHLEASAYRWTLSKHRISDPTALTLEQANAYREEAWRTYMEPAGIPYSYRQWFMDGPTRVFADSNVSTGRGREIEINYNPDSYLSLKATITQQKAFDSAVSASNTDWMNERLAFWQSVVIPADLHRYDAATDSWVLDTDLAGKQWWTTWDRNTVTTTDLTPERWFQTNVESAMALINARAGQKKPQTREWRVNLTARYRLAGLGLENFTRNMVVGGSVRWQDKGAIGYIADYSITNNAGQYYRYDASRPVYDSSRAEADLMASYELRFRSDKIRCLLQLNVRNVFENGSLRAVGVNPDGTARDFRIIDPRRVILSATFSL